MINNEMVNVRFKLKDTERIFTIDFARIIIQKRRAKVVVIKELTQEIEINEAKLLKHINEVLHATITHEMKTPLNAIILSSKTLSRMPVTGKQAKLL